MSDRRLDPLPARADPPGGLSRSSASFALVSLILFWLWSPLGWLGTVLTLWCALFLPRSARG